MEFGNQLSYILRLVVCPRFARYFDSRRHLGAAFLIIFGLMQRFIPPLIDRILDAEPLQAVEVLRPSMSLEELKATVAREVESLLNSRRGTLSELTQVYKRVEHSVFAFGLEDFSSKSIASADDRKSICRSIELAIFNYEPRLVNAQVTLDPTVGNSQKVRFSIQAFLVIHPLQEPVSFDAVLQTTTQTYAVQSARRAL